MLKNCEHNNVANDQIIVNIGWQVKETAQIFGEGRVVSQCLHLGGVQLDWVATHFNSPVTLLAACSLGSF